MFGISRRRIRKIVIAVAAVGVLSGGVSILHVIDNLGFDTTSLNIPGFSATLENEQQASDYDRAAFGTPWKDVDGNGCDTRNDILRRDLDNITARPGTHGCVVTSGTFIDPYTGERVQFSKNDASAVQIDHVVALKNAWDSGANMWDQNTREEFANDPLNLLATTRSPNASKGSKAADEWMPAVNQCAYSQRQQQIKSKYNLSVTAAEETAWANACN